VLTTILGIIVGIALLSSNWLVRTIARVYVEIIRNTPLLVQIIFWFFGIWISLPQIRQAIQIPPESAFTLPTRFLLYIIALVIAYFYARDKDADDWQRVARFPFVVALIAAVELGFLAFSELHGAGVTPTLLIVLLVGVVLFGAAWTQLQGVLRVRLLAISVGLAVGGVLFAFAVVPRTTLATFDLTPLVYVSNRGMIIPEVLPTARFAEWLAFVVVGVVAAAGMWIYAGQVTENTGKKIPRVLYAILLIGGLALLGWWFAGVEPVPATVPITAEDGTTTFMTLEDAQAQGLLTKEEQLQYSRTPFEVHLPQLQGPRVLQGIQLQGQYVALVAALVIYTSSFIAEIVRAGIQAVPRGQVEAARALGLGYGNILQKVILPQALRVIIPPLGNQYLNLSKNSSLAIAIAFADAVQVTTTIMNQSGQSVVGITLLMMFYLTISLSIAAFTNWMNRRFQLVTR
jgi:general L-amino acid transport system permease protein